MPTSKNENEDRTISPESGFHNMPEPAVAASRTPPPCEGIVPPVSEVSQFHHRLLVVDDDASIRESIQLILESTGYEVLTAADGLDGLDALGQALPDVIISDLNMPRMSGFEFLAVVRQRFPHIATIAMSGTYNPNQILADAFLQKGQFTLEELIRKVGNLVAVSPIRSEREKRDLAPLFVPRDSAGYLIITCPNCLRPNGLEASNLNGGIHQTICRSCGSIVKFEINHEIEPLIERTTMS